MRKGYEAYGEAAVLDGLFVTNNYPIGGCGKNTYINSYVDMLICCLYTLLYV